MVIRRFLRCVGVQGLPEQGALAIYCFEESFLFVWCMIHDFAMHKFTRNRQWQGADYFRSIVMRVWVSSELFSEIVLR